MFHRARAVIRCANMRKLTPAEPTLSRCHVHVAVPTRRLPCTRCGLLVSTCRLSFALSANSPSGEDATPVRLGPCAVCAPSPAPPPRQAFESWTERYVEAVDLLLHCHTFQSRPSIMGHAAPARAHDQAAHPRRRRGPPTTPSTLVGSSSGSAQGGAHHHRPAEYRRPLPRLARSACSDSSTERRAPPPRILDDLPGRSTTCR